MTYRAAAAAFGTLLVGLVAHLAARESPLARMIVPIRNADIETESGVQNAISNATSAKYAIMFLHVDWAPMELQRTRFAEFVLKFKQTHPNHLVQFHYVDITSAHDYGPLRAMPGWKQLEYSGEFPGQSLIHGEGEVVWLKIGQAMHVERIENFKTATELIDLTEKLMPANDAS